MAPGKKFKDIAGTNNSKILFESFPFPFLAPKPILRQANDSLNE